MSVIIGLTIFLVMVFSGGNMEGGFRASPFSRKKYTHALDIRIGQYRLIAEVPLEFRGCYK